ncbi:hypothetical protein WDW86_04990 [Bdellovibrionota bacterium FG-2]
MDHDSNRRIKLTKLPSEVFKECPRCESPKLLRFEGEVFCLCCDWDSIKLHMDCQMSGYHLLNPRWPLPGLRTKALAQAEADGPSDDVIEDAIEIV